MYSNILFALQAANNDMAVMEANVSVTEVAELSSMVLITSWVFAGLFDVEYLRMLSFYYFVEFFLTTT